VGTPEVDFVLDLTVGDANTDLDQAIVPTTFSSAFVNVPEPGSFALALASLGTVGLMTRVRRRA
jgi:hypothetical protein